MSASEWIEDIDGILRWTSALGREHLFARGESGRSMPLTAERQVTVTLPPESDMACTTAQAEELPVVIAQANDHIWLVAAKAGRPLWGLRNEDTKSKDPCLGLSNSKFQVALVYGMH